MNASEFSSQIIGTRFRFGASSLSACDCWGLVELYYKHVHDVILNDRADHGVDAGALQSGFEAKTDWFEVEEPVNGDLVIMRSQGLDAGHVGVFINGNVLHAANSIGVLCEPMKSPVIKASVTKYLRHEQFR